MELSDVDNGELFIIVILKRTAVALYHAAHFHELAIILSHQRVFSANRWCLQPRPKVLKSNHIGRKC